MPDLPFNSDFPSMKTAENMDGKLEILNIAGDDLFAIFTQF